jgi:hypothetical protein|tara:strand:+ start:7111 stop:7350 length:240 start_codon:yes stop_codon:yes gene_type:complete
MNTTPLVKPENVPVAKLEKLQRAFQDPTSNLEAFALYGVQAALKERDHTHREVRGVTDHAPGSRSSSERFDEVLGANTL